MYRIGIDVGGTFTDLVAVDDGGASTLAKVPSTPADQSVGVMEGLTLLAEALGLDRAALLARTERIVHGTTVATNALLEHKGAEVGLLTTEGHRDIIEMREGLKDDRYNLRHAAAEQLVPRQLRLGVRERMRPMAGSRSRSTAPRSTAAIAVLQARSSRGRCDLLPARLARPDATSAQPREARASAPCPASMSRSRPRCCRRSRSTIASARRSSTPMSARRCSAI